MRSVEYIMPNPDRHLSIAQGFLLGHRPDAPKLQAECLIGLCGPFFSEQQQDVKQDIRAAP
jgi:hypothetical protein